MSDNTSPGESASQGALLRICLLSRVSSHANGGTAAYLRGLGQALERDGHKVEGVAVFHKAAPPVTDYGAVDTGVSDLVPSAESGVRTRLIAAPAHLRWQVRRLSSLLTRDATRKLGISLYLSAFGPVVTRAIPPDTDVVLYVGNGFEMLGFAALSEARRRNIPLLVTPFVHPESWGDSPLDVLLYNQADAVLVCSASEAAHLEAVGVKPESLRRIALAPAPAPPGDAARFRDRYGLGTRPLVLFIGRKERYKGYHALCESMSTVCRDVPDACLVAIGPDREPPFPTVPPGALLDLGELGQDTQGERQKQDALAACDVFCMPSEAEAFGIVYVEAWANGKPVVGGPAPAVRELIQPGETGFHVTQEPREIAQTLVTLLKDPALAHRLGEQGRILYAATYNWPAVAETHESLFREMRAARSFKA